MKPTMIALLLSASVALCHDAKTLAAKYPPVQTFVVRPGVLMTATFASDGQVCEIVLEKRHRQTKSISLSPSIESELLDEILNELVPNSERGTKNKELT